jgi:iron complex outermembrane receptor protein
MRKIISFTAVVVFLIGGGRLAFAEEKGSNIPSPEVLIFRELPDVWSATRTLRSPLDVPNEVTVITADDIRRSGATSIVELLETVPSLEVMRVSRADANISARGFNPLVSSRVLAMIDGRSVFIDFMGMVFWESLNVTLQEIDRIEVIRGPGSVLYGANALMGIINIITKRPHEMPKLSIHAGVGPETGFITASGAKWTDRASLKGSVKYRTLDHFRNEASPFMLESRNRHQTGQRLRQFNSTFEYLFDDGTNLSVSGGLTGLNQAIGTQMGDFLLDDATLYYGKVNVEKGLWRFQGFVNGIDTDLPTAGSVFPPPLPRGVPFRSRVKTTTFDTEITRSHWVGNHTVLWGVNFRRTATTSKNMLGGREQEAIYGAFLQDEFPIGDRFLLLGGVRFDEHPKAGFHISPRASLVVKLGEFQRLRFLWAHSFRTPSHLYNYASVNIPNSDPTAFAPAIPFIPPFRFNGNEGMDSVSLDTYEVGYRTMLNERLRLNATLYLNMLGDFHELMRPNPSDPYLFGTENEGHTQAWGAELGFEFQLNDSTTGFASYHYQSANGDLQKTTPPHKVVAGLRGKLLPQVRYSLNARYVGHTNYDTDAIDASFIGDTKIRSRFNVDGYIGFQVRPELEVGLHGRNLFNQVRRHFPLGDEIGTELLATVRWEF